MGAVYALSHGLPLFCDIINTVKSNKNNRYVK